MQLVLRIAYSIGIGVFSTLQNLDVVHSAFQSGGGLIGLLFFNGEFHTEFRIGKITKRASVTVAELIACTRQFTS